MERFLSPHVWVPGGHRVRTHANLRGHCKPGACIPPVSLEARTQGPAGTWLAPLGTWRF